VTTPSLHPLIVQPGSGTSAACPEGEVTQGPSPVDYNLEIEADFPKDLVLTMQENAAKKARRTLIGRTLGGITTFKTLFDCLKLHFPTLLVSVTLLTRGYFEILLEDEEGAKATRRLTVVEWSGLGLSFARYIPNFDASSQGAEAQLTHAIKVQFPDLHEQFRNTRALTIMASKLGEVLEIKAADSYIKRPAGPMITIELRDISKLPGYIRISSMAEGAETNDTITQRILYSGLSNQCRKCRRFGHHARICTINRSKPQERVPPSNGPLSTSGIDGKKSGGGASQLKQDQVDRQPRPQNVRNNQTRIRKNPLHSEARSQLEHPTDSAITNCSDKLHRAEIQPRGSSQIKVLGSSEVDHVITKLASSPGLNHDRRHLESAYTSKAKLNFGFREANSH
jgi:hypothetical protein